MMSSMRKSDLISSSDMVHGRSLERGKTKKSCNTEMHLKPLILPLFSFPLSACVLEIDQIILVYTHISRSKWMIDTCNNG